MQSVATTSLQQRIPSLDDLEQLRDYTFRRLPALRVQGPVRAVRFINDVGLASLFATRGLNLPSLWLAVCGRRDPQFPHHSHHDPEVGLAWNLKDQLPAQGKVFYAKLIAESVIYATRAQLVSVLGDRSRLQAALADLMRAGLVDVDCRIDGLQGRWLIVSAATRERLAGQRPPA